MLFETKNINVDELKSDLLLKKNVQLMVARLDKIHPVISGNKLFKLHYFLKEAMLYQRPVVTFGGAYSNHLVATAYACKIAGLSCTGIVRGEVSKSLSSTLLHCRQHGMHLEFISREKYSAIANQSFTPLIEGITKNALIIPEGGFNPVGAEGAALIMNSLQKYDPDFICIATGTATTLAGVLQAALPGTEIIAVPVLKNFSDISERLLYLNGKAHYSNLHIWDDYHFGGYAKKTPELLDFMNELYKTQQVPSDFVYTAKLLFAVMDKIKNNWFPQNSKILCLHTGGLQGNHSLPGGSLIF